MARAGIPDPYAGTPTKEEIEGYKADWKKKGFPDFGWGVHKDSIGGVNEGIRAGSGELSLWTAYLALLVADYLGESSDAEDLCIDCHLDAPCGERKSMIRAYTDPTGRLRTIRWTGVAPMSSCPTKHTFQQCAERVLFHDPGFEEFYTSWLGTTEFSFSLSYLRKNLQARRQAKGGLK